MTYPFPLGLTCIVVWNILALIILLVEVANVGFQVPQQPCSCHYYTLDYRASTWGPTITVTLQILLPGGRARVSGTKDVVVSHDNDAVLVVISSALFARGKGKLVAAGQIKVRRIGAPQLRPI
jgi:hypothetical protein